MWIVFFAILMFILRVETGDDYDGLAVIFQYLFMTYRNSVGDISTPGYAYLDSFAEVTSVKNFMLAVIWIVWLVNQILNLIILLNFLIAVISQVYDNVVAEQQKYRYMHKSAMN